MEKVPYINYAELDEFYTIQQLAKLFGITKQDLKERCEQHGIEPRRNEVGEASAVFAIGGNGVERTLRRRAGRTHAGNSMRL